MRSLASMGVAAMAVAGLLAVTPERAGAVDASFQALAVGDGVRVTVTYPNAPLTPPEGRIADFGGPVAQVLLDSIGESSAYASFPFPGAGPATSPALVRGASGGALPVPDYPFFVFSKAPANPEQEFGSGPYAIRAESDADSSSAGAAVGLDGGDAGALGLSKVTARSESTADAIVAAATSDTAAVHIGPLTIGRVFSTATATFGTNGALTKTADTVVEGVKVGDSAVTLTPEGLKLAGSDGPAADLGPLHEALAQAQVTVELLPRREADTGVAAPAVRVTQKEASGGKIVYTIGAASAYVDATLFNPPADPAADGPSPETVSPTPAAESPSPETDSSAPASAAARVVPPAPSDSLPSPVSPTAFSSSFVRSKVPLTYVVPDPPAAQAPAGVDLSFSDVSSFPPVPGTPEVVALAAAPREGPSTAARLLISSSDTRPLFAVLVVGAILGLGVPGLVRLRGARG